MTAVHVTRRCAHLPYFAAVGVAALFAQACSDGDSATGVAPDSAGGAQHASLGQAAAIDIEKATNGHDADTPTGPSIPVGDPVTWTYVVTNTGTVRVSDIVVEDNQLGRITCPLLALNPGEAMTCAASGTAQPGQYANTGTVVGYLPGNRTVSDSDPSHYFGGGEASLDIEKATNGHDADEPAGPVIPAGDPVTWTYVVTNTGTVRVSDIAVTDDRLGAIDCPLLALSPGESMTCTANGTAQPGQYANIGTVVGYRPGNRTVTDSDPSHYFGLAAAAVAGEGCSHGYWKNHLGSWGPTGFTPGQSVASVFAGTAAYPATASATLQAALRFSGGPTVEDAVRNLLKQAVGSLLNAGHPGVGYPRTVSGVIAAVNGVMASGDRTTILSLAEQLDRENNLGCPLD